MTKHIDPLFVRVKDIKSILHQRLPNVNTLFNLRFSEAWYQHRL